MNLSDPSNLLIAGIYFAIAGGLVFFAIFAVYVLVRYGQNRGVAVMGSLIFTLFFLTILNNSYIALIALLK